MTRKKEGYIRKKGRGMAMLLACLLFITTLSTTLAFAEPESKPENDSNRPTRQKIVRVGTFSSFNESADLSTQPYAQYTEAFLEKIALYTGWTFEYVQVDVANERVEDLLVEGKIDLGTLSVKTDANEDVIGFSNLKYGTLESNLITLIENEKFFSSDYSTLQGMKVALVKDDIYHERVLEQFCNLNGIAYTKVFVPNYEAAFEAMKNGQADTAVAVNVISIEDTKKVATLGEAPFYFSFAKDRPAIARGVNQALESIFEVDEDFQSTIEKKYFVQEDYEIKLSKAEQEYIEKNKNVRLVIAAEAIPLQYFDNKGNLKGIVAIFLDEISEMTGLEFTVMRMTGEKKGLKDFAKNNDADLILGPTAEQFEKTGEIFAYTATLLEAESVLCANRSVPPRELKGKTFAAVKNSEQREYQLNLPKELIKYYDNYEDAFEAINTGRADYTYCNQLIATYYLLQSGHENIISVPLHLDYLSYKFALVDDNEMLQSILNKAIGSLSESTKQELVINGMKQNSNEFELTDLVKAYGIEIVFVIGVLGILLAVLVMAKIKDNRELLVERMRVVKHNELTDELIYEYDVKKDIFKTSEIIFEKFGMACEVPNYTEYIKNNIGQTAFKRFLQDYREKILNEEGEIGIVTLETVTGTTEEYRVINAVVRNKKGHPMIILGKLIRYEENAQYHGIEPEQCNASDDANKEKKTSDFYGKEQVKREFIYERRI